MRCVPRIRFSLEHATAMSDSLDGRIQRVLGKIESLALEVIRTFADGLHAACWLDDEETRPESASRSVRDLVPPPRLLPVTTSRAHPLILFGSVQGQDLEERLIVAMANSAYAREEVVVMVDRLISALRPDSGATSATPRTATTPTLATPLHVRPSLPGHRDLIRYTRTTQRDAVPCADCGRSSEHGGRPSRRRVSALQVRADLRVTGPCARLSARHSRLHTARYGDTTYSRTRGLVTDLSTRSSVMRWWWVIVQRCEST
jgi:hypothetical protein